MTRDELKALWAELGENHYNHRIGDYANEIPPGPPRPGPDETDWKAPRVHAMLETHIRGEKKPLLANLRAFPPRGTINEVWNHGDLQVHRRPTRPSPAAARAPSRSSSSCTPTPARCSTARTTRTGSINYEYNLVYGLDGKVDETNPTRPTGSRWVAKPCSPP